MPNDAAHDTKVFFKSYCDFIDLYILE